MKTVKHIICILFLILVSIAAFSQDRHLRLGNKAYEAGEYNRAVEKFKKAYSRADSRELKGELAYKMGICSRRMNLSMGAKRWFNLAALYKYPNPRIHLYHADALMKLEDYEEAKEKYEKYKKLVPDDPRGERGIKSCNKIQEWKENPTRFKVEEVDALNYYSSSDFSPSFAGGPDLVYFTSSRETADGEELNHATGKGFTDIFYSMKDRKGEWSEPAPIKGEVNTEYDEGAPCVIDDGFKMYYTGCEIVEDKEMGCKIFISEKEGRSWKKPGHVKLYEDSSVSVGHPAVTEDGLTMYFASDKEGGEGGKDIWKTTRKTPSDKWTEPTNLGEQVNTQGNELYPYIRSNGELYFSSDGRVGMGGLDIYKAVRDEDGNWEVENMKYPINSYADDFGITFLQGEKEGLLSTTRDERRGRDNIYRFWWPPLEFKLVGVVKEEGSGMPLDATVKLHGSDGTINETKTETDGVFKFDLDPSTDYRVVTTRESYLNGKGKTTTRGLEKDKTLKMEVFMAPIDEPIELPRILYDYNKANLRPESKVALDDLIETLNDNPKVAIELSAHTDFRGTAEDNIDLSQRRAQSAVDYLIKNGIDSTRLNAKGYGESVPNTVSKDLAEEHDFLEEGTELTEEFIKNLDSEKQKEVAHQINRRTEFKVTSTDYEEEKLYFGGSTESDSSNINKENEAGDDKEDKSSNANE